MSLHAKHTNSFYYVAAFAAIVTAVTNLYIHLTDFPASSFEERIVLFKNKAYIANRIIIIIHCVLVIISTWGMGLLLSSRSKGFAQLGMLAFIVFGLTEITRMVFSLSYVNGLREKYFAATDISMKQMLEYSLNNTGLVNDIFFRIFIVAFATGLLCYGIALLHSEGRLDKLFGMAHLVLSGFTFLGFANDFIANNAAEKVVHWASVTLQPFVRLWMGLWIYQSIKKESV